MNEEKIIQDNEVLVHKIGQRISDEEFLALDSILMNNI